MVDSLSSDDECAMRDDTGSYSEAGRLACPIGYSIWSVTRQHFNVSCKHSESGMCKRPTPAKQLATFVLWECDDFSNSHVQQASYLTNVYQLCDTPDTLCTTGCCARHGHLLVRGATSVAAAESDYAASRNFRRGDIDTTFDDACS